MRTPTLSLPVLALCSCAAVPEVTLGDLPSWLADEQGILENQVQLTFPDRYARAGEAYFSPDGTKLIFQAIETPPDGAEPDEYYAMFVADLVAEGGRITAIENTTRLSPLGSFNTCGWFHPRDPSVVLFASTLTRPAGQSPGYQRDKQDYRWQFPPEMNIFECNLAEADGTRASLRALHTNDEAYLAECSLSPDGRYLLYCSLESNGGDIYVRDLSTGLNTCIVSAPGYDGGPFFSPDGRRICYRSDRRGNDLLQLFVGDLAFDSAGAIVGLDREYQLTDNRHVNFAPFWHPGGRFLVYLSSEEGHHNYELFVVDADPGNLPGSPGPVRYGTRKRRISHARGFDGFPAFNADGSKLIWTSQRDGSKSQVWVADFVMDLDAPPAGGGYSREH